MAALLQARIPVSAVSRLRLSRTCCFHGIRAAGGSKAATNHGSRGWRRWISMADLSPLSASSERSLYVPVADVEDLKEYTIGGYHPTKIGDRFSSDRYTVVHKLGFGGYSTVWLVRDESSSRYVALKILVADASPHSTEGTILQRLTARQVQDPGQRFLSRLLAQFSFAGPNGHHVCFVQEAAGCSVALARECSPNFMFPPDAARSIAAQLILGVSYIHSQGVCHGGE